MNAALQLGVEDLSSRTARLLSQQIPQAQQLTAGPVQQLFGGNARKAYAFDVRYQLGGLWINRSCVMLSAVGGGHVESHLGWEHEVLSRLEGSGVRSPAALALDQDGDIIGAPSIILERITGKTSVVEFLAAQAESDSRSVTLDLAEAAARLHAVDLQVAGFAEADGDPMTLARAQLSRWKHSFESQRLEPLPVMAWLYSWLEDHLPRPQRISLVHGDMRPGNFLYEGERITALLDWEMAHLGDPIEDIGWIYRPMWSPKKFVELPEFVERYAAHSGVQLRWRDVIYYRIFSEIKFATISLSAAAIFSSGKSHNLRHIDRASKVNACLSRCMDWVEQNEWDQAHA